MGQLSVDSQASLIARARIVILGWQPFYRRPVRRSLLAAIDQAQVPPPDHWGLGDGPPEPLDRAQFSESPIGRGPMVAELVRKERPAWQAEMSLDDRAWLNLVTSGEDLDLIGTAAWFRLADALVDALQPDLAFAHLDARTELLAESERERRIVIDAGIVNGNEYYERGPGGLGMRTWIGPWVLRQLGTDRVRQLPPPAVVRPTDWGGLCVDLIAEPWQAEPQALAEAFAAAMAVLVPAGFFSNFRGFTNNKPRWERNSGADLGGTARESPHGFSLDRDARATGPGPGDAAPDPSGLLAAAHDGSRIEDLTLSWVDLRGADLRNLNADGLVLSWAQLEDARLDRAHIEAGEFDSADLSRAHLEEAKLVSCYFARSLAPDSSWRGASLELASLENAVLTKADFSTSRIDESRLDEAALSEASFAGATIQRTSFRSADCRQASFAGATLHEVDFTDADLRDADFAGATLTEVKFDGALRSEKNDG